MNYDVYRYDYEDYKGIPGVIATQEREAYAAAVEISWPGVHYRRDIGAQALS